MFRAALAILTLFGGLPALGAEPGLPPPLAVPRASALISIDGDLGDPGWKGAAVIDSFWETQPGNNVSPKVKTTAWVTYDDRYFYIAVKCDDPDPRKIRAPYVDRDNVIGTDDNVAIFLDTRNDRRSAVELRVNPRGIQGDAVFNDANGNEDFSPDFFYDSAARITADGWQAELRIPFSTLRYPKADPQTWGILIWRNHPREYRYAIHSSPVPRGSNCLICRSMELTGLTGLPSTSHMVVAPFGTAKESGVPRDPADPASGLVNQPVKLDGGVDVKWTPSANLAIDGTVNPDFSQVEADVAQISVNTRFALFYPEKRPFFLESVDLLDTPIQAAYTRTITSPRWGARATGKADSTAFTILVTQDRGGGSVIVPGPTGSDFAPQDFGSYAAIARVRQDLGGSFAGFLVTDREVEGGGYNRVFGPDFQWRPNGADMLTGQALLSATETPNRPDLSPDWNGRSFSSRAFRLNFQHSTETFNWLALYKDYGEGFRADVGFVPQVGFREAQAAAGYTFYPAGLFSSIRPLVQAQYQFDTQGALLTRRNILAAVFQGRYNLVGELDLTSDAVRVQGKLLPKQQFVFFAQVDPSSRFPRVGLTGFLGEEVDYANARVGNGGEVGLTATIRPTDHLELAANTDLQWLNVTNEAGLRGRLFTAVVGRLKATYNFDARTSLRAIGQWVGTDRNPELYTFPVPETDGVFSASILFAYRLNWQTVFFLGYDDTQVLDAFRNLQPAGRQFFLKVSYAFQM
jgi:hypothetical protein